MSTPERNPGSHSTEQEQAKLEQGQRDQERQQHLSSAERSKVNTLLRDHLQPGRKKQEALETPAAQDVSEKEQKLVRASQFDFGENSLNEPQLEDTVRRLSELRGLTAMEKWDRKDMDERREVLQTAYQYIAESYGFKAGKIRWEVPQKSDSGWLGSSRENLLRINEEVVRLPNPARALEVLAHEARHAYQDHVIKQGLTSLPKEQRVQASLWKDNARNYKRYNKVGFAMYRYQPLEVDAREFGSEIVRRIYGDRK